MTDFNSRAEQNARMRARADYFRWLNKYYGSTELTEMSDEPEPVSLRQIFVPMRIGTKNLDEAGMAKPAEVRNKESKDRLPGQDAFELIAKQPFVCLSGLPGSGKTTLTKALVGELCSNHPSSLRAALFARRGIAPIPVILREIQGIARIRDFDGLMQAWWQNLQKRSEQGDPLDIERLKQSFSRQGENFPLLILFDGIDETGGPDVRTKIIEMAAHAYNAFGCRVLVTGRPNGFQDLSLDESTYFKNTDNMGNINTLKSVALGISLVDIGFHSTTIVLDCVYYLLPLTWPQIEQFIGRWYRLRPEWEIKRIEGTQHFLEALQDANRPHLLTLARRPIFLTLMALVHCTRNEMPHGRADLYEAIVDLYLNRQERHRQLKYAVKGHSLKVWPTLEKRRVLARIAYASQVRGSD
ncbi:MAG: NACHT domain-containing protein, partial [Blastocatellia bacterium]